MSRLRTDFYNDSPVEDEVAKADKDVLALDFVGNTDSRAANQSSELATPSFGIRLAEKLGAGCIRRQGFVLSLAARRLIHRAPATQFNIQGTAILAEYACRRNLYASGLTRTTFDS